PSAGPARHPAMPRTSGPHEQAAVRLLRSSRDTGKSHREGTLLWEGGRVLPVPGQPRGPVPAVPPWGPARVHARDTRRMGRGDQPVLDHLRAGCGRCAEAAVRPGESSQGSEGPWRNPVLPELQGGSPRPPAPGDGIVTGSYAAFIEE